MTEYRRKLRGNYEALSGRGGLFVNRQFMHGGVMMKFIHATQAKLESMGHDCDRSGNVLRTGDGGNAKKRR